MATPEQTLAAAQAAIDAASALVNASQALVNNAHAQMTATPPTLTLDGYREVVNQHAEVVGKAATIRQTAALDLGAGIEQSVTALQATTAALNQRMAKLATIQNAIDRGAQVLAAAGALAALVAAPSLAAVEGVVTAIVAIGG
jgi:hypothetical protein